MTFKRTELAEHGTMTRYRQHIRDGEKHRDIDQACKDARNENYRQYQQTPERRAIMTRQQLIRRRALTRLANERPERFLELIAEEDIKETWREMHSEES